MRETNGDDAIAIALSAISWIISEPNRAERFLALTGLAPQDLRERLTDPDLLDACFTFLEGHQPDLIACAQALEISPERLIAAKGAFA